MQNQCGQVFRTEQITVKEQPISNNATLGALFSNTAVTTAQMRICNACDVIAEVNHPMLKDGKLLQASQRYQCYKRPLHERHQKVK